MGHFDLPGADMLGVEEGIGGSRVEVFEVDAADADRIASMAERQGALDVQFEGSGPGKEILRIEHP